MQFITAILLLSSFLQISNAGFTDIFKSTPKEEKKIDLNWHNLQVSVGKFRNQKKATYSTLPETTSDAKERNWSGGRLPNTDVVLYCESEDTTVCALYDQDDGKLVGVQIAITELPESLSVDGSKKKKKVNTFTTTVIKEGFKWRSINDKNLLVMDIIFPHHVHQLQGMSVKRNEQLSPDMITVFGKQVRQIPIKEQELTEPNWYKQNCEDAKGTHYGYGLTKDDPCVEYYPIIPLVKQKKVVGLMFMVPGQHEQYSSMHWIQTLDKDYMKGKFPKTSKCFQKSGPYSGIHVSFVDPKVIGKCEKKDHIKTSWFG